MSITNDFQAFAIGGGANVESQADYLTDPALSQGQQTGIASSALNNKVLRQATYIASQVAQYLGNVSQTNMQDNATPAELLAQMFAVWSYKSPVVNTYTSGSGNWNMTYKFQVASANATSGATYTNNGVTYTVLNTISSGLELQATGNGAPTTSGTLTKASGTGDSTITFYAVRAPLFLKVKMVGGGGGGGGSGTTSGTSPTAGGNTTFGTSLLVADGGGAGTNSTVSANGGTGGSGSLGSGPNGLALSGANGGGAGEGLTTAYQIGGYGANSAFGGGGQNGPANAAGVAGTTNTGAGGGGAGTQAVSGAQPGSGGGAGGFVDAIITSLSSTYAYAIGGGGTAGAAGTSGYVGGAGASGVIVVEQHYQ